MDTAHKERLFKELKSAGMTPYGFMKMETAHLPKIIHNDEHIGGVVYGRTANDKVGSAMLIATNKRVIFLDCKPLFTTSDEVTYGVVAGVKMNRGAIFVGVTLHTRVRDYSLRYVNHKCAKQFVSYIEKHIERHEDDTEKEKPAPKKLQDLEKYNSQVENLQPYEKMLRNQDTAVLSTVDREGNAYGAVVHYWVDDENQIFVLTRDHTAKAQNIDLHGQVALTVHETDSLESLQISGLAVRETNKSVTNKVFQELSNLKKYKESTKLPPVLSMKKGSIVVIRITPIELKYRDFSTSSW